jgi:FdhE protein
LCRTQWEYARIRCVRCGTREQTKLEYLYDEADPPHRVHTCAACHGYSLTTFEREMNLIALPEIEEVVMVRLEAVATSRGFSALGDDTAEKPN